MEQGWLLDVNKIPAYTLEELTGEVCGMHTLDGKPKVVLAEEYGSGKLLLIVVVTVMIKWKEAEYVCFAFNALKLFS